MTLMDFHYILILNCPLLPWKLQRFVGQYTYMHTSKTQALRTTLQSDIKVKKICLLKGTYSDSWIFVQTFSSKFTMRAGICSVRVWQQCLNPYVLEQGLMNPLHMRSNTVSSVDQYKGPPSMSRQLYQITYNCSWWICSEG